MVCVAVAGTTVMLVGTPATIRLAAAFLLAAGCTGGVRVVMRRGGGSALVLAAAAGELVLFAMHVARAEALPLRILHVAAVFSYVAVAVAAVIAALRIVDGARALLLTFSIAFALLAIEVFQAPRPTPPVVWEVNGLPDPNVEYRYAPYSIARTYYVDNPRNYFQATDPIRDSWFLETHHGSQARLEHQSHADAVRVTIERRVGKEDWSVKLQRGPYRLARGRQYILRFRARADSERPVVAAVGQNHAPWETIGGYSTTTLTPAWTAFEIPFVSAAADENARIFFDLASRDAAVELADVRLVDASGEETDGILAPDPRFYVEYRFNGLGFRGPDRPIPRPANTFRILALGDSFAMGVGVHEQHTVSSMLESRLQRSSSAIAAGTRYEVINAGVSGYGTRQELRSYELFAAQYDPRVVLLTMVFNDDMSFQDEARLGLVPGDNELRGPTGLLPWFLRREGRRPFDYADSLAAVRQLDAACRDRGASLAVVVFTTSRNAVWSRFAEAVHRGLAGTGIPILDLRDALLGDGKDERELFVHPHDDHPNEIAHAIAAREIERFLDEEDLIPSGEHSR